MEREREVFPLHTERGRKKKKKGEVWPLYFACVVEERVHSTDFALPHC